MYQRGRIYNITVGDTSDALSISDLQITFDISKSSSNKDKTDSGTIEIYNLSDKSLAVLEKEFIACVFSVGYYESGLKQLFTGEVTQITTRKSGVDRVTQLQMGSGYVELNHTLLNKIVPAGKTIKDVVEEIRKQMPNVVRGIYAGFNINSQVIYGYPLTGSPRKMLDEISRANEVEWRVDNNTLYVNDTSGTVNGVNEVQLISKDTGLIEIPYKTSGNPRRSKKDKNRVEGVQFTALLNAEVKPGSLIRIESEITNGYYKVDSARYSGGYRDNDWIMECFCSIGVEDT